MEENMNKMEFLTSMMCTVVGIFTLLASFCQMMSYNDLAVWHDEDRVWGGGFGTVIHAAFCALMFMDISLLSRDVLIAPKIDFIIILSCAAIIIVFAVPVAKFWSSVIKHDAEFYKFCKNHQES